MEEKTPSKLFRILQIVITLASVAVGFSALLLGLSAVCSTTVLIVYRGMSS